MTRFAQILTVILSLFLPSMALSQDFEKVEITATEIAPGIYMLTGAGGNMGLSVGEDGAFLIDDQFAPLSEKILAKIAELTDQPVRFLLNTHWHGDHTGGNEAMGKAGAVIVAHENVRARMSTEQTNLFGTTPPSPEGALPVVTFSEDVTFHWNGETIHVFHVEPAHTDGDAVVHFEKADVIHTGDLLFNGRYPVIDAGAGGSPDGMVRAADRLLSLAGPDTRIIPGHGPAATEKDLEVFRTMLATIADRVKKAVADGKSLEDVKAMKPTAEFDAAWGGGFMKPDKFVEVVYGCYARK